MTHIINYSKHELLNNLYLLEKKNIIKIISTPIIVPYNLINDLGYILDYYCYIFESDKEVLTYKTILNKLKIDKLIINDKINVDITNKLKQNFKVTKISKLFEISTNDVFVKCDFLRPNLVIGSLVSFSNIYNNKDIFITAEIGKVFNKNNLGKRIEKECLTFILYYINNTNIFNTIYDIFNVIIPDEYILKKQLINYNNNNFEIFDIIVNNKKIGEIVNRYNYDCSYFNKINSNKKILFEIKNETKINNTEIKIIEKLTNFDDYELNIIKKIFSQFTEDQKLEIKNTINENGYYSLYDDENKKFFLLKKDMLEFKKSKSTKNIINYKIPCIIEININISNNYF